MKKIISITLTLLILFSGISVKFATHYCGGIVVATKVSLTGELATCGMENSESGNSSQETFTRHCCDDVTADYSIDNNYEPSFSLGPEFYQSDIQTFAITSALSVNSFSDVISSYIYLSPPGVQMSTNVDLSDICVFLI